MKLKLFLASILVSLLAFVMLSQASLVTAETLTNSSITGPITTPISYFTISGRVSYKFFRIVKPAENVTVEATSTQTSDKFSAQTNKKGQYTITVPAGQYNVRAFDFLGTIFDPALRLVDVTTSSITGINFRGNR